MLSSDLAIIQMWLKHCLPGTGVIEWSYELQASILRPPLKRICSALNCKELTL